MDIGNRRLRRRVISSIILAIGCGVGDRRPADLQLDIEHAELHDTDNIRVCIQDAMVHETTVGDGRIAISGVPNNGPIGVTVNVLEDDQSVGGTQLVVLSEEQPWSSTPWMECTDDCKACSITRSGPTNTVKNSRMLAIHFIH